MTAAYRMELVKLLALQRVRLALGVCVLGPVVAALVLRRQTTLPVDTLFGRFVQDTGFAFPLLMLGFVGQWALPALASVVAGDVFASEDRHGTWKTLLTRSLGRGTVFWGKVLATTTYVVLAVALLAAASVLAGLVLIGDRPLVGLSGQSIPAGQAAGLVVAAWVSVLPPTLVFTAIAILISVATRNGPAGVGVPVLLALANTVLSLVALPPAVRLVLPGSAYVGWRGLFADPGFTGPLVVGLVSCAVLCVLLTAAAQVLFSRREVSAA